MHQEEQLEHSAHTQINRDAQRFEGHLEEHSSHTQISGGTQTGLRLVEGHGLHERRQRHADKPRHAGGWYTHTEQAHVKTWVSNISWTLTSSSSLVKHGPSSLFTAMITATTSLPFMIGVDRMFLVT